MKATDFYKQTRKMARTRLADSTYIGKNTGHIFGAGTLNTFIYAGLKLLNSFNLIELRDMSIIDDKCIELVAHYVVVQCLASSALNEKGHEFSLSDQGISYTPPECSDLLQKQFEIELESFYRKIDLLKKRI